MGRAGLSGKSGSAERDEIEAKVGRDDGRTITEGNPPVEPTGASLEVTPSAEVPVEPNKGANGLEPLLVW